MLYDNFPKIILRCLIKTFIPFLNSLLKAGRLNEVLVMDLLFTK